MGSPERMEREREKRQRVSAQAAASVIHPQVYLHTRMRSLFAEITGQAEIRDTNMTMLVKENIRGLEKKKNGQQISL